MRSEEKIRAQLAKEREILDLDAFETGMTRSGRIKADGIIAALEWALTDEQPRPEKCRYCRGKGRQFEAFTMEEEHCLRCDGTGDEPAPKPKETGDD